MKISWKWVTQYLEPAANALDELEAKLIQAGIEFEKYDPYSGFEIVTIDSAEPIGKNLKLCKVGDKQIVCGAENARPGLRCILANVGCMIPANRMIIQERQVYGHLSQGMLCSSDELMIEDESIGLYEVRSGETLDFLLRGNGPFYDLDITPNRGDLLSAYGIARELSALGLGILKSPKIYSYNCDLSFASSNKLITVKSPDVINMYGILLNNVENNDSPMWIKQYLYEVGIKHKSAIVDITNYIAHSLGQPTHAFDYDVVGNLTLTVPNKEKQFIDLHGKTTVLQDTTCILGKNGDVVSLPGVIGAELGKSTEQTKNVLLEAGVYTKSHIYNGQKAVCQTTAAKQFFWGVDPSMTKIALCEAAFMAQDICKCSILICETALETDVKLNSFVYRDQIAGMNISIEVVRNALCKLGFKWNEDGSFTRPSWRNDIIDDQDLTEEVLRIIGYQNIQEQKLTLEPSLFRLHKADKIRIILASLGFYEIISSEFTNKEMANFFGQDKSFELINPMKASQFSIRNSILQSLIVQVNQYQRYNWRVRGLFEIGKVFTPEGEHYKVGFAIFDNDKFDWASNKKGFEYCRAKEVAEKIMQLIYGDYKSVLSKDGKILENGCEFVNKDKVVGRFGEISRGLKRLADIKGQIYLGEIELDEASFSVKTLKETDQRFVERDISFILPAKITWNSAKEVIQSALDEDNQHVGFRIFDVYPNPDIQDKDRSIAINLIWDELDRTLSSEEINATITKVEKALEAKLGCQIKASSVVL